MPPKISVGSVSFYVGGRAHQRQAGDRRVEGAAAIRAVVPAGRAVVDRRHAQFGRGPLRRDIFADVRRGGVGRDAQPLCVGGPPRAARESPAGPELVGPRRDGPPAARRAARPVARSGTQRLDDRRATREGPRSDCTSDKSIRAASDASKSTNSKFTCFSSWSRIA